MLSITTLQIKKLHVLLNQLGLMADKRELIKNFTSGRTESSREMTMHEATELIAELSKYEPCNSMRRKVFALAYKAGIIWGQSDEDKKMNAVKLNQFILKSGTVKKELGKMNNDELVKTVNQFGQIVKHNEEGQAARQTKNLLDELQIQSSFNRRSKAI